jgi:hypothetical protein
MVGTFWRYRPSLPHGARSLTPRVLLLLLYRCSFERGADDTRCQFYKNAYESMCPPDWVSGSVELCSELSLVCQESWLIGNAALAATSHAACTGTL